MEQLVPLERAAQRLNLSQSTLLSLINAGRVEAMSTPDGVYMSEEQIKTTIVPEQFDHLKHNRITVSQAAEKYNVHRRTILVWVKKNYINVITPGYKMILTESDVAFCAAVYHAKGGRPGMHLFDSDGLPYQLKWPDLSTYRNKK